MKSPTRICIRVLATCAAHAAMGCSESGPVVDPGRGSLGAGVERRRTLAVVGAHDDAVRVADRMLVPDAFSRGRSWLERVTRGTSEAAFGPATGALDALGFDVLTGADRAEIEYARAVTLLASAAAAQDTGSLAGPGQQAATANASTNAPPAGDAQEAATDAAGRIERAVAAYERARAAGGAARVDAVYALGSLDLAAAEAIRATIPEISGGPPPPPSGAEGKDDEDPVDVARRTYLRARERFVELLRLGDDPDARANTELIVRRLRELDAVETQREEQQKQDQQQQEQDPSESEEGDSEQNEDPESSEDQSSESKDGDEAEQPEENEPQEDDSEEQDPESEQREESEEEADAPEEAQAEEEEPEERLMTEEERKRLLEQNRAYQKNGEKLRRALRLRRKVPAKRDW
ncbi:MAG: hypothetical protein AAGB93_23880 [Planctomycetota bacterium]